MKNNKKTLFFFTALILIAILGGFFLSKSLAWGPWAFSDSAAYVGAARNFSSGKGFTITNANLSLTHLTEFPPGYSLFLSFFLGLENDINTLIRWINICLFALFLFLFGTLIFSVTQNHFLALIGMLFCLYSPVLLEVFSGVISETLFFPFLIGIFFLFFKYIQEKKAIHLVLFTLLSSILPIIRYAGLLFVFVFGLALVLCDHSNLKIRLRNIFSFFTITLAPIGIWILKLYCMFLEIGGKNFRFDPELINRLINSVKSEFVVMSAWLPYQDVLSNLELVQYYSVGIFCLFLLLVLWIVFRLIKNRKQLNPNEIFFLLSLFTICAYVVFIAFTHSITVPQIDIIDRMLAPLYPLFISLLISGLSLHAYHSHKYLYFIFFVISFLSLRFTAYKSRQYVYNLQHNGHGYSARQFQQSEIIHQIKGLPKERNMISNSAGFVLYYENRLPLQINQFANRTYGTKDGYGERTFRDKGAYLILLYPDFFNYYGDQAEHLLSTITSGLDIYYQDDVGGIYIYPKVDAIPQ